MVLPEHARVERRIPKSRLFERIGKDVEFRQSFEEYVEEFVWMFTLDEDRLHTPGTPLVSKIDVIFVEMRKEGMPKSIIQKIERKLPSSVKRVYFCRYGGEWEMVLNYRPGNPEGYPEGGVFFSRREGDPDQFVLPTGHNLWMMYAGIVRGVVSVSIREGEKLDELVLREYKIRMLERQAEVLQRKIRAEVQPQKRIAQNLELQWLIKQIREMQM